MNETALLTRQMHTLTTTEIGELARIAKTVFEPLIRPFRQKRTVAEFDYRKSIKKAQKIGHLLPAYSRVEREHRKSRLVVAMSLSGIDRCAAISLIPLLSELRRFLDFKLYVYTSDLIEAEFTHDGFLANDHEISWNNVAAPVVFSRLAEMDFDKQEDTLLLIDSLGGGDSEWYWTWNKENQKEAREEQKKYLIPADQWGGYWVRMRDRMAGDYDITKLNKSEIPAGWKKAVERNCIQRWVNAPALVDYLVRWMFNPEFGKRQHGDWFPKPTHYWEESISVRETLPKLRGKFRSIHLLSPNYNENTEDNLHGVLDLNTIDYYHRTDTIEGLATVLANIVHNRCTDKLTYDLPKFQQFIDTEDETTVADEAGEVEHDEMAPTPQDCFVNCEDVHPWLPLKKEFAVQIRRRGTEELKETTVPYNKCDISEWFPNRLGRERYHSMLNCTPQLNIDPGDSKFTHIQECERFLREVQSKHIVPLRNYTSPQINMKDRPEEIVELHPEFEAHHTRALAECVQEVAALFAPCYKPYIEALPLANVVWCSSGKFKPKKLSVGINPQGDWKRTTFHEVGHYFEHISPEIGAFTNHLIRKKVGEVQKQKLINIMPGEKAMPVQDGSTDWINIYAGKWYPRDHQDLPNPTEILSMHLEYFASPERLLVLAKHDPFMVKFIAYIIMGGPVAAFQASQEAKLQKALQEIDQRNRTSHGHSYRGRRGRYSSGGSSYTPKKKDKKFGV